jgi:acetyltransferase-like isoleucine patch superfamily enzyme
MVIKKTYIYGRSYFYSFLLEIYDYLKKLITAFFYILSELESLVVTPSGYPFFRRVFLKINKVKFGKYCFFGHGLHLYKSDADFVIGDRACFGENCGIYIHGDLEIGEDFLAAPGLTINSGSHDIRTLKPISSKIMIGDRVWCGVNVTIVAGANIGHDCIIGANSLVLNDIPAYSLAVGVPARIIKKNIREPSTEIWRVYPKQ